MKQEEFRDSRAGSGFLLADMMLEDGAKLPAEFGALPRYEADLLANDRRQCEDQQGEDACRQDNFRSSRIVQAALKGTPDRPVGM
jgi:2-keto-4-pentenoate hydratase